MCEIDTTRPAVPYDVFCLSIELPDLTYDETCEELWNEVLSEALDPEFSSRTHYNTGTYDQGCRGPLCRKALRDHPRRKDRSSSTYTARSAAIYDPVLDYFHVIVRHRIKFTTLKEQIA